MPNWIRFSLHGVVFLALAAWALLERHKYYEDWYSFVTPVFILVILCGVIELAREIGNTYPDGTPFRRVNPDRPLQWEQLEEARLKIEANTLPGESAIDANQAFDEIGLTPDRRLTIMAALFLDEEMLPTSLPVWIEALRRYENDQAQRSQPRAAFLPEEFARFSLLLTVQRLSRRAGSGSH